MLAMAPFPAIPNFALILDHCDFCGSVLLQYLGIHLNARDGWRADPNLTTLNTQKKHLIKDNFIPCVSGEFLYAQNTPFFNNILFSSGSNDSKHTTES